MIQRGRASSHILLTCAATIVASLVGTAVATSAHAQRRECATVDPMEMSVEALNPVELTVDSGKSLQELRALAEKSPAGHQSGFVLGHYRATARYRYKTKADGSLLPSGGVCIVVKEVAVQFGFSQRTIFIAKEVHDYPCVRDVIVGHEKQHVVADEGIIARFIPYLLASLELEYASGLTIKSATPEEARTTLKTILDGRLDQSIEELEYRRQQAHREIDDANQAATLIAACGEEARTFLRQHR